MPARPRSGEQATKRLTLPLQSHLPVGAPSALPLETCSALPSQSILPCSRRGGHEEWQRNPG